MDFALLPLLRKQSVINEIYLRDNSLLVECTSDGRRRFAGLQGPPKKPNESKKQFRLEAQFAPRYH
jgi:uncharacterized protein involved in outer membrane biogenesis